MFEPMDNFRGVKVESQNNVESLSPPRHKDPFPSPHALPSVNILIFHVIVISTCATDIFPSCESPHSPPFLLVNLLFVHIFVL